MIYDYIKFYKTFYTKCLLGINSLRLLLAAFLGAIIGVEREIRHRAAGFRTHIIVSVGACLVMLIGVDAIGEISSDKARDVARMAGQVVSGIGFLGAGTILQKKDVVSGLTTAATLWLSAAIGLAVGIGYYVGAIFATVICLITLVSLKGFSDFINKRTTTSYIMTFGTDNFDQDDFLDFTKKESIEVRKLDIVDEDIENISIFQSTLSFPKNYDIDSFFEKLKTDFHLKSVRSNE